ncbi:MAG: hypothetical protein LBG29_00205 [Synergistaceae bacterium]|jgi:hypothetical protein|nr:hypothetical protein [Synergistaceae bacterium]
MFGLNPGIGRASRNFYRNVFALAAFAVFAAALLTDSPICFAAAAAFGALSRTAVKKNWKTPAIAGRLPWLTRKM